MFNTDEERLAAEALCRNIGQVLEPKQPLGLGIRRGWCVFITGVRTIRFQCSTRAARCIRDGNGFRCFRAEARCRLQGGREAVCPTIPVFPTAAPISEPFDWRARLRDRTRFLRRLEEVRYVFLIRRRRFGKSCWVSVLENYYDRNRAGEFEALFGGRTWGVGPGGAAGDSVGRCAGAVERPAGDHAGRLWRVPHGRLVERASAGRTRRTRCRARVETTP